MRPPVGEHGRKTHAPSAQQCAWCGALATAAYTHRPIGRFFYRDEYPAIYANSPLFVFRLLCREKSSQAQVSMRSEIKQHVDNYHKDYFSRPILDL